MRVRTRFAPSPTGYLHVGGVRTALFAWLLAQQAKKQAGGEFILRIEDTDRSRHVEDSEQRIMDSLEWLGLKWDEGPFRQSERLELYQKWAHQLIDSGRAYADPYSEQQLQKFRQQAKDHKKPFLFRDFRPAQTPDWQKGMPLRFKSEPKSYNWTDEVMGELTFGPEAIDDFILIKSDGFPTYNFAHIIDDHEMAITHVIRSQEFLSSVPKFLNLYDGLGIEAPKLATLPYVMGPDGKKKLSKRDGAKDILDYRREGYLPEALLSFLATLGWNDGTEQEIFSVDELIEKFSLSRVQRSGARFDERRLEWVSGHFMREKPLDALFSLSEPFWPPAAKDHPAGYKKSVLGLVQERLKFLGELPDLSAFFFDEPADESIRRLFEEPSDKQLKNMPAGEFTDILKSSVAVLKGSDFSHSDISAKLNSLLEELSTKPGILFAAIRIAVTGSAVSPELFGTLHVLGKQISLARLEKAVSVLGD
jgi:glutamyl-tRNA synthetase